MEPFRIYGKTELGTAALTSARGAIASSARQLLILVDGQRTLGDLRNIFGADALALVIPQLEQLGYIQYLRDGEGAGPPTQFAVPVAAAVVEAAATTAPNEPAPAGRNGMAIAALSLAVLGASGAIWWFLGPTRGPAVSASAESEAAATPSAGQSVGAADAPVARSDALTAPVAAPPVEIPAPRRAETRVPDPATAAALGRAEPRATAPAAVPKTPIAIAIPVAPAANTVQSSPAATGRKPGEASATAPASPPPTTSVPIAAAAGNAPAAAAPAAPATTPQTPVPTSAAASGPKTTEVGATPAQTVTNAASAPLGNAARNPSGAAGLSVPVSTATGKPVLHPRDRVMPVLSRRARRAGIDSGELIVRLHISDRGFVQAVDVVKANPPQVYDTDIEQTLEKWTFDPPGTPVVTNVEFNFKP